MTDTAADGAVPAPAESCPIGLSDQRATDQPLISFTLPSTAGNTYQNLTSTVRYVFTATQRPRLVSPSQHLIDREALPRSPDVTIYPQDRVHQEVNLRAPNEPPRGSLLKGRRE